MGGSVILEKLTKSQRSNDRYYAEFDSGEGLSVTVAHIADFGLFTGRELTEAEFNSLKAAAERTEARSRALRMLGTRPMSEGEIIEKLVRKGVDEAVAENVADWLSEIGAVNDEEYAAMIVSHYSSKGYGAARVKNELFKRKVPRELWDGVLEKLPESDDTIDRLISSRLRGAAADRKELKKVSDMLLRRGFSYDEIRSALRRYSEDTEEE